MLSDNDLYTLAVFLGSLSMLLIILYHFLEVNAREDTILPAEAQDKATAKASQARGDGQEKPALKK